MPLRFTETPIPGVILVEPQVFGDRRGFFLETFHRDKYAAVDFEVVSTTVAMPQTK